ncbi:PH domain-containing protein [Flavobacterium sp. '19STA2R22 D10 B1']|uniref:PH domain-containing protein n=1 Tax=Flavobacterium aerium TaxID=3037261 RepID=UPI00278C6B57|nr:PH domain-containing protein [Flavobacterium sp. '19STA2R22 D10 B1']
MKEQFKKFLNEEQDPKAVEKITTKLNDLLMKNEEIYYIGVQKKPALTVFPDSIVLTNKRIIICKPKNLGLSMDFTDYTWDDIAGAFVKENILGSDFSFTTKTDLTISIDYIPKTQARKIYTFAKEQLEILKEGGNLNQPIIEEVKKPEDTISFLIDDVEEEEEPIVAETIEETPEAGFFIEEVEVEEVQNFAEIIPAQQPRFLVDEPVIPKQESSTSKDRSLGELSQEELFDKLQNYKKLLDNGLILQGEYDAFKKEILSYM